MTYQNCIRLAEHCRKQGDEAGALMYEKRAGFKKDAYVEKLAAQKKAETPKQIIADEKQELNAQIAILKNAVGELQAKGNTNLEVESPVEKVLILPEKEIMEKTEKKTQVQDSPLMKVTIDHHKSEPIVESTPKKFSEVQHGQKPKR